MQGTNQFWTENYPVIKYYTARVQKLNEEKLFDTLTSFSTNFDPSSLIFLLTFCQLTLLASIIKNWELFCVTVGKYDIGK